MTEGLGIFVKGSDKTVNSHTVLLVDGHDEFDGIHYYYDGMRFADEENPDGSIQMTFEYELVDSVIPEGKQAAFEKFIGDQLLAILEQQIARGEVVYNGGDDKGTILED